MDLKKEFEEKFCHQMMNLDGSNKHYVIDPIVIDSPQFIIDWIESKIKEAKVRENEYWLNDIAERESISKHPEIIGKTSFRMRISELKGE